MNTMHGMKFSARGFTLIELLVTMMIVGILASIAVPSYTDYITKSRRARAAQLLAELANRQEQFMLDNKTYARSFADLGYPGWFVMLNKDGEYDDNFGTAQHILTITPGTATASGTTLDWTLRAFSWGIQRERDTDCQGLILDSLGEKDAYGADADSCW